MMAKGDCFAPRMFRRLLVPSLASSLGLALADMADAVVVGQRMGATGLAAISLSLPLYMVFNVCMHGLGIGGSVRYSRLLGEGKAAAAVACFNRTMRAGLALGVLIALLVNLFPALVLRLLGTSPADGALFAASESYVRIIALGAPLFFASYMLGYFLRSDDQQKLASAGFLVGNGVDILLNLVFVLWLDGGTAGAAWATLLGLVATLACYAPGLVSRKRILRLRWPRAAAAIYGEDGSVIANAYVDISMNDVMQDRHEFLARLLGILAGATLLLIVLLVLGITRAVVRPINTLSAAADAFVSEKRESGAGASAISQLAIRTGDEIENLSHSIQKMEQDINRYIDNLSRVTAEKERIGAELNVATQIQASMLPCIFPAFPSRREFDIYATMTPAKEVGGDFYDFFLVDDDHLALVMADVSGKGVPAALFMVIAKTLLKNAVQTGLGPKAALEKVNNQLCENNEAEMFVTVWLGVYEISSGKLVAANAGHEKPAILRADGKFELYSDKHGFVLAGMENTRYREYALQLEAGDALFVYTDGVAEATDARNTLYGTQRMLDALNRNPGAGPEALLRQVKADIDAFVGEAPQFDDITMLALKVKELPSGGMKRVSVAPDLASVAAVTEFVEACLAEQDAPMKVVAQVNVAVDEIFSNIARYSGATAVSVGCEAQAGRVLLRFSDNGRPYDPTSKADPDVTLSAEERDAGGLGIFMVKKTMDRLAYEYEDGFNVLTLEKAW